MTQRKRKLLGFTDFLRESGMIHDSPPDYGVQTWIHENREAYHKEHGKDQGERLLYSKAWQDYNALNTNNKSE